MNHPADCQDHFARLHQRVLRIEHGIFNAVTVVLLATLAMGLFAPFLAVEKRRSKSSSTLFSSVFGLDESGVGALERHPVLAGIPLGIYLLVVLFAVGACCAVLLRLSDRRLAALRIAIIALLVGSAGAWLFFMMAASDYPELRMFSPATIWLTVGAVIGLFAMRLGNYILNNDVGMAVSLKKFDASRS